MAGFGCRPRVDDSQASAQPEEILGATAEAGSDFEDAANGHYSTIDLNLNPGRVNLYLNADGIPYKKQ